MATIGQLIVDLLLESASFQADLKKAADATARHTGKMRKDVATMEAGFARAASVIKGGVAGLVAAVSVGALNELFNATVRMGDAIDNASKKIGISAEHLQRFRQVAAAADIEAGSLDSALKALAENIAKGDIKTSTQDLGANFLSLIDKIRQTGDAVEKQKLAASAFGSEWQTALALANKSAAELAQQWANAKVLSNQAVANANEMTKAWDRFETALATGFAEGVLKQFTDQASLSEQSLKQLNETARLLGTVFGAIVSAIGSAGSKALAIINAVKSAWESIPEPLRNAALAALNPVGAVAGAVGGLFDSSGDLTGGRGAVKRSSTQQATDEINLLNKASADAKISLDQLAAGKAATAAASKLAAEALREHNAAIAAGIRLAEETQGPYDLYLNDLADLQTALDATKISQEEFNKAALMGAMQVANQWLQVANTVSGALGTMFKENKSVAIAQAVINTALGITGALSQAHLGPLAWVQAAAIAAAGAAQIATILSAQPGSAKAPRVGGKGGGKGTSDAVESAGEVSRLRQSVILNITGESFGPEHFKKLIAGLNGVIADGAVLRVNT